MLLLNSVCHELYRSLTLLTPIIFFTIHQINELRLLVLKQQQQIQDLEIESNNHRYHLENLCNSNDAIIPDNEYFVPSEKVSTSLIFCPYSYTL